MELKRNIVKSFIYGEFASYLDWGISFDSESAIDKILKLHEILMEIEEEEINEPASGESQETQ